jgi:hypothetical protein
MFRALLAHLQEGLHKQQLPICVRVMSVCCTRVGVEFHFKCGASKRHHSRNMPIVICAAPPEDEQVELETCGGR